MGIGGFCFFCDSEREVSIYLDKDKEALLVLFRENLETCPIYWVDRAEAGLVSLLAEDAPLPVSSSGRDTENKIVPVSCLPVLETSKSFGVAFSTIWNHVFRSTPDVNPSILSKVRLGDGENYTMDVTRPAGESEQVMLTSFSFCLGSA